MVERNMLICKRDTTGTEKYYLSKLPLEISGRSPEDNPDIERTNPIYANSIEIRKKAGQTLINSRKQLKASPSQAATITPLTLAEGVAEAQKADAKRELNFTNHPQQHSNKRSKTTASITRTAPTGFIANTSDSLESVEEPPTKPIDLSQSSSSDSSDSEDSDSDDTPTKNNNTGFMDEEVFNQVIPAARNKGTDFNNVRDV